jgi:hypothetical protein
MSAICGGMPAEETGVVALFPLPLDVVPPVAHEHDADGPVADDLVRDVSLLEVRVARRGNVNHAGVIMAASG